MFTPVSFRAMIGSFQDRVLTRSGRRELASRPRHADRARARLQLEGLEARCLMSGISGMSTFPTPSQGTTGPNPTVGITTGPDGNVWFTENTFSKIGMINPATDAITEFPTPTANAGPYGITAGPDGNLWFTENAAGKIGMINPATGVITEFATPTKNSDPLDIVAGPDGNLWFTENGASRIGMINPATHTITEFKTPTKNSGPFGITAGPNGNLWFTEEFANNIAEINTTTHAITEFPIPVSESLPESVTVGSDGNLWYSAVNTNCLGTFNLATHAFTQFVVLGAVAGIVAGPDGNVWFTESADSNNLDIGCINPTTDVIEEYPGSLPVYRPYGLTTGPDGNLWFTEYRAQCSVGVANLNSSQLVVTQPPPASITAGSTVSLTVTAEDSTGKPITSFNGTVTVALGDDTNDCCEGALGGVLSVAAIAGVATFSGLTLPLNEAGSFFSLYTSGGGFGWGLTNTIAITPAAAAQVVITAQPPSSVTAGSSFGLQASIEDPYGNLVNLSGNVVALALANNPSGASLGGTLSATTSNGVATFSGLTLTAAAAGYTLQVSSSGLSSATSSAITVTPAAAAQVVISEQPPTSVVVSSDFALIAAIEDAYGNVETSSSGTIKVALDNNPGSAKLGGTLSVKASKGVAAFSGLTLNKVGTGYTLELTSSGLSTAVTNAIAVTTSGANVAPSAASAAIAPDPLLAPLVLESLDVSGGLAGKKRGLLG